MARLHAPEGDAFYVPPTDLSDWESGDLIWSRPVGPPAALEEAARSELVLYRSVAANSDAIAVSGIVALPGGPVPDGGWPVVSWAHGTLGLGGKCAPSRDRFPDRSAGSPMEVNHRINQAPHVLLNAFLRRRWAVAMTDFEGMGVPGTHPYMLGESEARGILDIVLAARELSSDVSNRVAIAGHSQGGQAALFAAHRAPDWPDLDLRCVGAIAPASHATELLILGSTDTDAPPNPGFAFTALWLTGAMVGAAAAGRPIDPRNVLTPRAHKLFVAGSDLCRVELSEEQSFGGLRGTEQFLGDIENAANGDQAEFLRQLTEMNPDLEIEVPIRIAQARMDFRVLEKYTSDLVRELLTRGNDVTYTIYERPGPFQFLDPVAVPDPPDIGIHFGTIERDVDNMASWLAGRLV